MKTGNHQESSENDIYRQSIFTRIVTKGTDCVLYNSFGGTKSLLRIPPDKSFKVHNWLKEPQRKIDDSDFNKLIQLGHLVPINTDEKKLRELRYLQYTTDNRLHLVIHVTKACNFRCLYCYMDFNAVMLHSDIQEGIVNFVKKNIQKYRSVRVSWFGGEPLLGMGIIESISEKLMHICHAQNKPYSAMVTTNGYNLTPENIQVLLKCNVTHIAVTVDGTKDLHDSQRVLTDGSPTFDRIIQNLVYIKDNIRSRTLTISIRTNMTKAHMARLNEYYDFFDETFGEDHRFSLFVRPVADYGGQRVKKMEESFLYDMSEVYEKLLSLQKGIKFFPNFIDLEQAGYTCTARQLHKFTIGCDGAISKCDEDLSSPIGYLRKDGCMDINEMEHAKWLIPGTSKECEMCSFGGSCFMELCPKARIMSTKRLCSANFEELDSLVWLAANTYFTSSL